MAKKNKSTAQKIGGFVANEMLGIDDMRRVVKYVRKGDFKKAAKSAGAAAFEIGTSATAVGKAPALAVKAASKSVAKTASKEATKIGQKVGQKTAERLPAPKYPSAKGKKFNIKTEGKSTTTSKSGAKSTSSSSAKVSGTKKAPTENQRLGSFQGQTKTRTKTIVSTASEARSTSKPVVQKALAKQRPKDIARGVIVGKAVVKGTENKNKKKK
jgi:hypothetical protein